MLKIITSLILISSCAFATKPQRPFFDHSHRAWTQQLQKYVTVDKAKSTIDYKKWKSKQVDLDNYLNHLSAVPKRLYITWNPEQKQAFLINAYNAFTVKLILKHYPVKSIKKIGGWFKKPWSIQFFSLLGKKMDLDTIEHEMLRKNFNEPRVHFAVNCASIGCPMLTNQAYTALKLNQQLDKQARLFLNDASRNKINIQKKQLNLSKIFKWFKGDFQKNGGTVAQFVLPYMTNKKLKSNDGWDIDFLDYNWQLNE